MRLAPAIMKLPPTLLLLIAAQLNAASAQEQAAPLPTAVRKMAPDAGEKFFHEYCAFDPGDPFLRRVRSVGQGPPARLRPAVAAREIFNRREEEEAETLGINSTAVLDLRPPFAPHLAQEPLGRPPAKDGAAETGGWGWDVFRRAAEALGRLERRQGFQCPTNTNSCIVIGYPNSCCGNDETCVHITNTGLGNVGCCPKGQTCGGSISSCPQGDLQCAATMGGGCCIPGFVCHGIGCIPSPTTPAGGAVTITTTSTSIVSGPTQQTIVVTVVITETPSVGATTSTTTETVTAQPSGSGSTETSSSTESSQSGSNSEPAPAVRPTTLSSSPSTSQQAPTTTTAAGYCPAGFYACHASAGGGCCQTGRNCETTSCPPLALTTIISSGVTIAVPLTDIPASTTGTCASGWFLCGTDAGPIAGCCPNNYQCGTASCSLATAGGTATVAKELPGGGAARPKGSAAGLSLVLATAVALLWLF